MELLDLLIQKTSEKDAQDKENSSFGATRDWDVKHEEQCASLHNSQLRHFHKYDLCWGGQEMMIDELLVERAIKYWELSRPTQKGKRKMKNEVNDMNKTENKNMRGGFCSGETISKDEEALTSKKVWTIVNTIAEVCGIASYAALHYF